MAISSPGTDAGAGKVYIHDRNEGGLDQWGVVQVIEPDPEQIGWFGRSLGLAGVDLVVGSNSGSWLYQWDAGQGRFLLTERLGNLIANAIAMNDTLIAVSTTALAAAGPGVFGAFDGVAIIHGRDPVDQGWIAIDTVVCAPHPIAQNFSCAGSSVAFGDGLLLLGDPCYQQVSLTFNASVTLLPWTGDGFSNTLQVEYQVDNFEVGSSFGTAVAALGSTVFMALRARPGGVGGWILAMEWDVVGPAPSLEVVDTLFQPDVDPDEWAAWFGTAMAIRADARVYVGGEDGLYVFDPEGGAWAPGSLAIPMARAVSSLSIDDGLLAVGMGSSLTLPGEVRLYRDGIVGTSESQVNTQRIRVYPNPALDHAWADLPPRPERSWYRIRDVVGNIVDTGENRAGRPLLLERKGMQAGWHTIEIIDLKGEVVFWSPLLWQ